MTITDTFYENRKRLALMVFLLAVFVLLSGCGAKVSDADILTVDVLKIGKADTAIFQYDGHCVIIDCGEKDDGAEIAEFLDNAKVDTVNLLILTHFDKDHIGGAAELMEKKSVRQILAPDYDGSGKAYENLMAVLEEKNLPFNRVTDAVSLDFGAVKIRVMPSGFSVTDSIYPDKEIDNDMSLVTLITYGDNKLLFAGDLEAQGIKSWLAAEEQTHVDLLKVPHHGRYSEGIEDLLGAVSPDKALICCSDKNPPDSAVLDALKRFSVEVWETRKGNIHIKSDGRQLTVMQ